MKCIHCFLCMFRKRWCISHYPILEYTITCGFMLDVRLELHWVLPLCSLMIEIFFWLVLLLITRVPSLHYAVCFIILITCGFRHSIGLFLCMDVLRSPRWSPPLQTLLLFRVVIDACSVQTSSIVYSSVAEVVWQGELMIWSVSDGVVWCLWSGIAASTTAWERINSYPDWSQSNDIAWQT